MFLNAHSHLLHSNRDLNLVKHQFLGTNEMPKPGTLVAIDAEFVLMQQVLFAAVSIFYGPLIGFIGRD
jgi:hypothetical protein